ncbi:hypothetical protein [Nocardia inohanensis]|uniref:hypothetical protein n=1 Tax=Nocardia inohanensis TaxID=209246 RepID=UPI000A6BFAC4|nr:hypothetical protein [Nocardia inohanensis]
MTWETWLLVVLLTIGVVTIGGALIEDWRAARRLDGEPSPSDREVLRLRTLDGGYLEIPFMTGRVTSHRGW